MGFLQRGVNQGLFGLQLRTTMLLSAVVVLASGLTGATFLRMASRNALAQTKAHASDLARALAFACAEEIEQADRESLLRSAERSMANSDLNYLIFTDMKGEPLVSFQRGTGNITHLMFDDFRRVSVEPIYHPRLELSGDAGPRIDVVYPVESVVWKGEPGRVAPTIGYVRLGVSLDAVNKRLATTRRDAIAMAIAVTLLMVPVGYQVVRGVLKPIQQLTRAAHSLATGRLDERVNIQRRDELGQLAGAFNSMADQLSTSHGKLMKLNAELEDRVLQRTMALEQANKRLREMASRDSLTGLYNRRHFNDLLAQLFAESTRYRTELTCMMLDLDNFKRVNDSLGHQIGDRLLRLTADVIQQTIRESDVAVRYGGDEFVVLMPQTSPDEARSSAERILRRFRDDLARDVPEASIASLSIGLASREPDQPCEPAQLVQLSDEALYLAKAGGKNRITVLRAIAASGTGEGI